jgi:hypothetical protein
MKDGKTHVTNFYTSRITGALAITVSTPIREFEEDIIGVLGIDIKFEDLVKRNKTASPVKPLTPLPPLPQGEGFNFRTNIAEGEILGNCRILKANLVYF